MADYDNTNRGSIWKNEKMRPDKQDPEFTGSLNVEGREYWVSAWRRKEGASDKAPALSFTIKAKEQQSAAAKTAGAPVMPKRADMDDEIPFAPEWR